VYEMQPTGQPEAVAYKAGGWVQPISASQSAHAATLRYAGRLVLWHAQDCGSICRGAVADGCESRRAEVLVKKWVENSNREGIAVPLLQLLLPVLFRCCCCWLQQVATEACAGRVPSSGAAHESGQHDVLPAAWLATQVDAGASCPAQYMCCLPSRRHHREAQAYPYQPGTASGLCWAAHIQAGERQAGQSVVAEVE
jgi:hypothetical protein